MPKPKSKPATAADTFKNASLSDVAAARTSEPRKKRRARIDVDAAKLSATSVPAEPTSTQKASRATHSPKSAHREAHRGNRPSALDAAAQLLAGLSKADASTGLTAPDLIERMAKAKLWTSPGGKTPAATLYAAMIREILNKGTAARFVRVSPGRFAASTRDAGDASPESSRAKPLRTKPSRTKPARGAQPIRAKAVAS